MEEPFQWEQPHSCFLITLQPGQSLPISSKYSWKWRSWLVTHFEQPVLWVTCFIHLLKVEKLPYFKVTNSSRLQRSLTNFTINHILGFIQLLEDFDTSSFKQVLDNTSPNIRALRSKCELHYQISALWSIPCKNEAITMGCQINGSITIGVNKTDICTNPIQPSPEEADNPWESASHLYLYELLKPHLLKWHFSFYIMLSQQGQDLLLLELLHT